MPTGRRKQVPDSLSSPLTSQASAVVPTIPYRWVGTALPHAGAGQKSTQLSLFYLGHSLMPANSQSQDVGSYT